MVSHKHRILIVVAGLFWYCSYTPPMSSTAFEESLNKVITEKALRVGFYSLASRQAENEGYGELAVYFSELSLEELNHVQTLSMLNVKTERTTKKNIQKAMKMEKNAFRNTYPSIIGGASQLSDEEGIKILKQIIQDEERHFQGLRGLIKKKRVK